MSSLIQLHNITKTYPSGESKLTALSNVNLSIHDNELVAIIGESGSGKSTMLNILGLLDKPTSGSYELDNMPVEHLSVVDLAELRNQKIGFVFQSFFLLPRLTALENVELPLYYRNVDAEESRDRAMQMLEKMGIAHLHHHVPNKLSGGQQQRVAIARALVGEPKIILADEPTGALDSKTSQEMLKIFINLQRKEGKTVIIVTHDHTISDQCDRIILLQDGKIKL